MYSQKFKTISIIMVFMLIGLVFNSCEKTNKVELKKNEFIKDWLLIGPFPNCENCDLTDYMHGENCKGFYTDFLQPIGGEANVVPVEGQEIKIPGSETVRKWFLFHSTDDFVHLNDIMTPNDLVVAYAFNQIESPKEQKIILSVGSNDGVKVWLNGKKIHEVHPRTGRWLQKDDDYVPVILKKGLNNLMLKVDEGGGDWGFVVRFLDYDSTLNSVRKNIDKYKELTLVPNEDTLLVRFGESYRISALNPQGKVKITILDKNDKLIFAREVNPGEEFKTLLSKLPKGFFTAKAEFSTPEDGVIVSEMKYYNGKLKRHPLPKNFNKNLLLPVDDHGKVYFPIGTYGAPVDEYQKLKEAGYTFVVAGIKDLDAVQKAGLKAAISVHGTVEEVEKKIRENKNHPAVLCWMLYDEPAYNHADLLYIYELYQAAYRADKKHASYMVVTQPAGYKTYGRCGDILSVDTYPVANGDITSVGRAVAKANRDSDGDQPIWHCGQLFKWPAQRVPTPQEHRFMTYSGLIEGAKGLLWYTYKGYGQYLPQDTPELWKAQVALLKEIHELEPLFMAKGIGRTIHTTDKNKNIRSIVKKSKIGTFLIASNLSQDETINAEFMPKAIRNNIIAVYGEDRQIKTANGKFKDEFKPLDVHIYKLK